MTTWLHYRSTYPQVHVLAQGTTALLYQHGTDEDYESDEGHRAKGNEGYESSQEDNQAKGDEGYEGKEKTRRWGQLSWSSQFALHAIPSLSSYSLLGQDSEFANTIVLIAVDL